MGIWYSPNLYSHYIVNTITESVLLHCSFWTLEEGFVSGDLIFQSPGVVLGCLPSHTPHTVSTQLCGLVSNTPSNWQWGSLTHAERPGYVLFVRFSICHEVEKQFWSSISQDTSRQKCLKTTTTFYWALHRKSKQSAINCRRCLFPVRWRELCRWLLYRSEGANFPGFFPLNSARFSHSPPTWRHASM